MKINTVYFNRDVPNPCKGESLRTNHAAGFTTCKELEITLHEDKSVFELYAPRKNRSVGVPMSNVIWFGSEGRLYEPEEKQEAKPKPSTKHGQGTSAEDSEGSSEKAGKKDEPRPKRDTVRATKGVRSRPKQK